MSQIASVIGSSRAAKILTHPRLPSALVSAWRHAREIFSPSTTSSKPATVAGTTTHKGTIIYALTVIVGACLLFLVQPLIAKLILPWFGGTSAVWSAALMFFQVCVFAGYAYAHLLATRLQPRTQAIVHTVLLVAACALMPILPSPEWRMNATSDPTLRILALLAVTVGLPAVLLSATSPLLQVWHMRRTGSEPPYWLYSLSNVGSLVALLGFPILLEPNLDASTLALGWSALFIAFAALSILAGWMSRHGATVVESRIDRESAPPSISQMTMWLLFAACGAGLLVSISAHLSTNVAPIPLLWVLPLALYLITFILAFGNQRLYNRATFFPWLAAALGCLAYLYTKSEMNLHIRYAIPLYLASLFVACMACHGELVSRRPRPQFLTRFYLVIALGGATGGAFVAVIAPLIFDTYLELPLLVLLLAELAVIVQWRRHAGSYRRWIVRAALVAGLVALAFFLLLAELQVREDNLFAERNFYGVLRVRNYDVGDELERRVLLHGTISHGYQFSNEAYRELAGSYYSTNSGIGRTLLAAHANGPIRVGVVGLGVGVLASYARQSDTLSIYEINPTVVRIANEMFDFVPQARARGAHVEVIMGDARLSLERQDSQQFDVLALDAFSSDAIPAHLLTHEAIDAYMKHLKPDGVLAIHISNRYLDLEPVCLRAAEHVGRAAVVIEEPSDRMAHASTWVLITSNIELLGHPAFQGADLEAASAPQNFGGWTDQYSNVWSLLKLSAR